jgi:sporulation protein YqfC
MKMQKVTDSFELPKDIVLGLPIVTAYGYNELTIENHKGISDKAVTVRAADSTIKISGSRLEIKEFTKDLIIIAGHLKGVIYEY